MAAKHHLTIEIDSDRLVKAKAEFPNLCPDRTPDEWTDQDFVHALAALHHRDFEIVNYVCEEVPG